LAEFQGQLAEVKKIETIDGVGMQGWVAVGEDWKPISVGNERLLKAHGGKIRPSKALQAKIDQFEEARRGELILFVCIDDEIKALMSLSGERCPPLPLLPPPSAPHSHCPDELRPDAVDMVKRIHQMNFQVDMLTGDHWEVAKEVCLLSLFVPTSLSDLRRCLHSIDELPRSAVARGEAWLDTQDPNRPRQQTPP
jgi:hypothetical protein